MKLSKKAAYELIDCVLEPREGVPRYLLDRYYQMVERMQDVELYVSGDNQDALVLLDDLQDNPVKGEHEA